MKKVHDAKRRAAWTAGLIALASATAVTAKNWDDWSAPMNLETMPGSATNLNTTFVDGCASHSRDGLTIVFNSNRDGTHDIYMAIRSSTAEAFGPPEKLPAPINTSSFTESCPTLGPGNRLYFVSTRDDPPGDIVVSKLGPDGWSVPENLGPNVNTSGVIDEAADFYTDDQGREVMIFSTGGDIYQSIDGGPKSLVAGGPHSSAADARASITNDGLTIFWDSNRTGTLGGPDLYYATRSNTSEPFGAAIHLSALSSSAFDGRPFISKDGTFLTFSSARSGSESTFPDIWFATREKVTGQ